MSSYRDDTMETAVVSDQTITRMSALTEAVAAFAVSLMFGLTVLHSDAAVAADTATGAVLGVVYDTASAAGMVDQILRRTEAVEVTAAATGESVARATGLDEDTLAVADQAVILWPEAVTETGVATDSSAHLTTALVTSTASARDLIPGLQADLTEELATAADTVLTGLRVVTTETAAVSDEVVQVLNIAILVLDSAHAADSTVGLFSDVAEDTLAAADTATDHLSAAVTVIEALAVTSDLPISTLMSQHVTERAVAADTVVASLCAVQAVTDYASAEDEVLLSASGQAWTAGADSWATSRYQPFDYTSVTEMNGVLYFSGPDGVYRLDGKEELFNTRLVSSPLDLSKGALAHPLYAYMAYRLVGDLRMTVSQSQSGVSDRQYEYLLPREEAEVLTTGRVTFGRGLRGRHFTFAINTTGYEAYLDDLVINYEPLQRKV